MEATSTVPRMAELAAPPSWRTVDFISDLHLSAAEPVTISAWQHYLAHTPADAVFMLGDLFEVWVGDDAAAPRPDEASEEARFEARCAEVLRQASQRLDLLFMHGNRDFLVGQAFMAQCRAVLLDDPTVLTFAGQRWLLSHGDALCLDDVDYLRFRQQVRGPAWQQDFLARPLAERQAIAFEIRRYSETRKNTGMADTEVDDSAARQWLAAAGAATLIHGHTHKPAAHDLGGGLSRIVLSDWDASAPTPRADVLRLSGSSLQRIALLAP